MTEVLDVRQVFGRVRTADRQSSRRSVHERLRILRHRRDLPRQHGGRELLLHDHPGAPGLADFPGVRGLMIVSG